MFAQRVGAWPSSHNTLIKSIQEVEISIASGATSNTATLGTAVDKNKSIILFHGCRSNDSGNASELSARVELTDGSTVTAYVNTASSTSAARIVRAVVCEFFPWVIEGDVLHGTILGASGVNFADGGTPNTFINSGNSNRMGLTLLGMTTDATGDAKRLSGWSGYIFQLVSSANGSVRFQKPNTSHNITAGFCQWVFSQGVVRNRGLGSGSLSAGQLSNSSFISWDSKDGSITKANCLLLWCGVRHTDGFTEDWCYQKHNDSDVEQTDIVRSRTTLTASSFLNVLEFYPKWVKGGKRAAQGQFQTANTAEDITVASSDLSKTLLSYLGFTSTNGFSNTDYILPTIKSQSATAVRLERAQTDYTAGGYNPIVSFESFEFR